jgi:hypothetical protein
MNAETEKRPQPEERAARQSGDGRHILGRDGLVALLHDQREHGGTRLWAGRLAMQARWRPTLADAIVERLD